MVRNTVLAPRRPPSGAPVRGRGRSSRTHDTAWREGSGPAAEDPPKWSAAARRQEGRPCFIYAEVMSESIRAAARGSRPDEWLGAPKEHEELLSPRQRLMLGGMRERIAGLRPARLPPADPWASYCGPCVAMHGV